MLTKKNPYASSSKSELKTTPKETESLKTNHPNHLPKTKENSTLAKKGPLTRIIIKYDVGFPNSIFIRGKGANLNWDKGLELKNIKTDEWIWESETPFSTCEFKVLINDQFYEQGENHLLDCGASIQYSPKF